MKFGDLVRSARLQPKTAQYVLRTKGGLTGMPKAGTQGSHRDFSLRQAFQLALCTRLVMAGIAIPKAAKVVGYCEKLVPRMGPTKSKNGLLYSSSPSDPWLLRILEDRYCQLWRDRYGEENDNASDVDYFDLATEKTGYTEVDDCIGLFQWNLTGLESKLFNAERDQD